MSSSGCRTPSRPAPTASAACRARMRRSWSCAPVVRALGLPLTLNVVVHRQNLDRLAAHDRHWRWRSGAGRLEIAHVQYYGWALANRDALLPTPRPARRGDRASSRRRASASRAVLVIDYVVPDYHARAAESLHGRLGPAVPERLAVRHACCPAMPRESLPGIDFPNVREISLARHLGTLATPSTASAAPTGCPSPARAASGARSTGAAAAARPSRCRATPPHRSRLRPLAAPCRAVARRRCGGGGGGGVHLPGTAEGAGLILGLREPGLP